MHLKPARLSPARPPERLTSATDALWTISSTFAKLHQARDPAASGFFFLLRLDTAQGFSQVSAGMMPCFPRFSTKRDGPPPTPASPDRHGALKLPAKPGPPLVSSDRRLRTPWRATPFRSRCAGDPIGSRFPASSGLGPFAVAPAAPSRRGDRMHGTLLSSQRLLDPATRAIASLRMARTWLQIRVELLGGRGMDLGSPPDASYSSALLTPSRSSPTRSTRPSLAGTSLTCMSSSSSTAATSAFQATTSPPI